ncbi:MAG TPA: 16S rRNA (cytosine(1402)-N(4))-methyltransferase RsmH [Candidatus Kapabacteria bacterium]|nr:16S rRNA (cytosine(1402)-N(4))-methyltransferase RsmH [Candidatus Kapabacteria bacterium]
MIIDESAYHIPVLAHEAVELLVRADAGTYVDATLGGGGYAERILKASRGSRLIAFDTDPEAIRFASERLAGFAERLTIVRENFASLRTSLESLGIAKIDGIVYDLGVSSRQFDTTSVGLSYRHESELDMRLDPRLPRSAKDVIASYSAAELAQIFKNYGEEPFAKRIAHRIAERRSAAPITSTTRLAEVITEGIREDKKNAVLSRIFQALRIEVNDELGNLRRSLEEAVELLNIGGRIVVVSYHSLEDRIVKDLFNRESKPRAEAGSIVSLRESVDLSKARLRLLTKKPVTASEEEIGSNIRARSAKMRAAERV